MIAGPRIRASVFSRSTESGQPPRHACPACAQEILPGRWRWRALLPITGRCPPCRARIGQYPLLAELGAGLALAVVTARASSVRELAALAWLVLLAVPLVFIDVDVHRLPDPLTAAAFAGTLALLAVTALAGHQPGHLGRAATGAVASVFLPGPVGHQARRPGPGRCHFRRQRRRGARLDQLAGAAVRHLRRVRPGRRVRRRAAGLAPATRTSHLPLGQFILIGMLAAIAW